ncbi:PilZ domain-containing protein [Fontivita pretiosa]|uniref:PilZ domain-containing protein n=1 Tax=Fontivita pretiosa TaxID=2989684 RepID=UPI003D16D0D3
MMVLVRTDVESSEATERAGSGTEGQARRWPAERRRGLRIRQHRPVKVYEPSSARFIGGQTHDVSATGLKIELPASAPVQVGKLLSIHVGIGEQGTPLANRRQMIPARVVWVNRGGDSSSPTIRSMPRLTAGVEFLASIAAHLDAA